jgi:hypothetical protein
MSFVFMSLFTFSNKHTITIYTLFNAKFLMIIIADVRHLALMSEQKKCFFQTLKNIFIHM